MTGEKIFVLLVSSFVFIFLLIHSIIIFDFSCNKFWISNSLSLGLHFSGEPEFDKANKSDIPGQDRDQDQDHVLRSNINELLLDNFSEKQVSDILSFYTGFAKDSNIAETILGECLKKEVPVNLAFSLAWAESSFNSRALNVNDNGSVDRGIFQLNNSYRQQWSVDSFYNIHKNIKEGLRYLKKCLNDTNGDVAKALGAYNAGLHASMNNALPERTKRYIEKILTKEALLDDQIRAVISGNDSM